MLQAVADRHTDKQMDRWMDRHCATIRASLACASRANRSTLKLTMLPDEAITQSVVRFRSSEAAARRVSYGRNAETDAVHECRTFSSDPSILCLHTWKAITYVASAPTAAYSVAKPVRYAAAKANDIRTNATFQDSANVYQS